MKVSRRFTSHQLNKGDASLLDVYEDYVTQYILAFASQLSAQEHSDVAVLILVTSILEPMGSMIRGADTSSYKADFTAAFQYVFGSIPGSEDGEKTAARVYKLLRHGLYHEGFVKAGVILLADGEPITEDGGIVRINVKAFLRQVDERFRIYIRDLRQAPADSAARRKFDKFWVKMRRAHSDQLRGSPIRACTLADVPLASTAAPVFCQVVDITGPREPNN
jgi:hypothetical protein